MNSTKCIIIASAVAAMVMSPVFAQSVRLDDAEVVARVEVVLKRVMDQPEAVGVSLAVARENEILIETARGQANLELDVPVTLGTVFRIGSVTKQFTAAAIMKLVERKTLTLDSSLHDFLPDVDIGERTVTIRQLLNHTSGIPSYTSQPEFSRRGSTLDLSHEELLAFIDGVPFDFEPGEGWNYSNTGYYLLGMIIEAVDGRSYAQFLEDEFFGPLGLTHTRYGSERDIIPNRAQGYDVDAAGKLVNDALISMNPPGAAGALVSTAGDLVRWQIALTEGRAVNEASYQQMVDSSVPVGQGGSRYGFGLFMGGTGEERWIGHSGGIPGFNSSLTLRPEQGLHVAMISNSPVSSRAAVDLIVAAITSEKPPTAPRTEPREGAEAAVRRIIAEVARGEPDYSLMSEGLAGATRAQLPQIQPMLAALGPVKSITFKRVTLNNADVFDVKMASGSLSYTILFGEGGIVETANFYPSDNQDSHR